VQHVVKANILEAADTPHKLIAIDLHDDKNLLGKYKIVVGIGATSEMSKAKSSELQWMKFKMQCRKYFIAAIDKTVERTL